MRGGAVWQLVGLITRRSQVQILPPLPFYPAVQGQEEFTKVSEFQFDLAEVEVIATNFKRRLSGVTSTIVQLIPHQRRQVNIATLGPGLPDGLPTIPLRKLPGILKTPRCRAFRIWHARRNIEMLAGLMLKTCLRAPLKVVFTSAAQRRHTAFTRFLLDRVDAVIATSTRSGGYLRVPYQVVRHGVDCARFSPEVPCDAPKPDFSAHPERFAIGCCGRVRHQKGTDLFVRAMIRLLPDYPDWVALIAGAVRPNQQHYLDALRADIACAGLESRIRFIGEIDDIRPFYRHLRLHVAPARNEGFGLTPLEAMACGTAVVASDAGSHAELIVSGKTGQVVPANDGHALIRAIGLYMQDPVLADTQGYAARTHVQENFSLQREVQEIQAVYEGLWDQQA